MLDRREKYPSINSTSPQSPSDFNYHAHLPSLGEVSRGYSYPLCQGVPFVQYCFPSYLTPENKAYPLMWTEYLDFSPLHFQFLPAFANIFFYSNVVFILPSIHHRLPLILLDRPEACFVPGPESSYNFLNILLRDRE